MEPILAILVGIGLAAACGFRIFVPFLVISIAANSGHLALAEGFEWIGTEVAIGTFLVATILEIGAYYVPFLDNVLDSAATPASFIAGTIVMASMVSDLSPYLQWALAIIAGGGVATSVQSLTAITRLTSSATTGGLGNPLLSTAEAGGSTLLSIMAVFVPIAAFFFVLGLFYFIWKKVFTRFFRKPQNGLT
ncbi:MAG: DUF4126 domain-containing protein [Candidatus Dadabacteria bacterium]|nr:DUF4126 domain-containing protein [Candidatus Dadabacteria bacterium]NIS07868.1 DUF4126 domain-containing protein [Candidatus Dadabacteria bacterium]NIV42888.1 DUF4126 family protein [Candidatus Dadabacteria bacterium]NIX14858.1 DUF4126 family protein [Candidatus Dadabacteria bacterium]NIY21472.1 DUF4126 family protein [Candidatus Dadabacteria bacterium]